MSASGGRGEDVDPEGRDRRLLSRAAAALVDWYADHARDLPWRRTRDPYRILVSEVMLQQTRVEAVRARYGEFLERFPDLASLAEADESEVLAAWSGLGYYRRARNLHRLARAVVADGGRLPADRAALQELPGIGDYTSAAVASIAFGVPALTVDGNVARVLSRLLAIDDDVRRAPVRRRIEAQMAPALGTHPPGELNQALMELGARICTPTAPGCPRCPCVELCRGRRQGLEEQLPPTRKSRVRDVQEAAAVIERRGRYLLLRGQRPGVLQQMWEFPTLDSRLRDDDAPEDAAAEGLAEELVAHLRRLGLRAEQQGRIGTIRHGITDRRIRCHVFRVRVGTSPTVERRLEGDAAGWYGHAEAESLPIAASTRRILDLLRDGAPVGR